MIEPRTFLLEKSDLSIHLEVGSAVESARMKQDRGVSVHFQMVSFAIDENERCHGFFAEIDEEFHAAGIEDDADVDVAGVCPSRFPFSLRVVFGV